MSEQVLLALIGCVITVATTAGGAWAAWMSYRMATLKTDQEKNAKASAERYERLGETCREVEKKTDQQTVMLNQIKGDANKAAEAATQAVDLTESAIAANKAKA